MEALETQITSLGSVKGVPVPEEMLTSLGLDEGSRVILSLHEGQLTMRPVKKLHEELEKWRDFIAASGVDLSKVLTEMRQEECEREDREERELG